MAKSCMWEARKEKLKWTTRREDKGILSSLAAAVLALRRQRKIRRKPKAKRQMTFPPPSNGDNRRSIKEKVSLLQSPRG